MLPVTKCEVWNRLSDYLWKKTEYVHTPIQALDRLDYIDIGWQDMTEASDNFCMRPETLNFKDT